LDTLKWRIYRRLGRACIDWGATVEGNVKFGKRAHVHPGAQIIAQGSDRIVLGDGSYVMHGSVVSSHGGDIIMGRDVGISYYCVIYGCGGLEIGDNVIIGAHTVIIPANHVVERLDVPIRLQGATTQGIKIEDDVWLASHVTVLDGVTIGRGSVVAAGAVVTRTIPQFSVAAGVPARVIGRRAESTGDTE